MFSLLPHKKLKSFKLFNKNVCLKTLFVPYGVMQLEELKSCLQNAGRVAVANTRRPKGAVHLH